MPAVPLQVGLECTKRMEVGGGKCILSRFHKISPELRETVGRFWCSGACPLPRVANLLCLFPLIHQPLMDNLESQTYEVFERTPSNALSTSRYSVGLSVRQRAGVTWVKMALRHRIFPPSPQAIYKCLLDRVPEEEGHQHPVSALCLIPRDNAMPASPHVQSA